MFVHLDARCKVMFEYASDLYVIHIEKNMFMVPIRSAVHQHKSGTKTSFFLCMLVYGTFYTFRIILVLFFYVDMNL